MDKRTEEYLERYCHNHNDISTEEAETHKVDQLVEEMYKEESTNGHIGEQPGYSDILSGYYRNDTHDCD